MTHADKKKRRRNGEGSIVKKGSVYYYRGRNPATGRITTRALRLADGKPCTRKDDIGECVKRLAADWRRLDALESKEEVLLQLARTRRLIAETSRSVGELWQCYMDSPTRPTTTSERRMKYLERAAKRLVEWMEGRGETSASAITRDNLQGYLNGVEKDLSARSYNEHLGDLSIVLRHAWKGLGLDENPIDGIARHRAPARSRRDFTPAQVEQILSYLDTAQMDCVEEYRTIILLALYTGARMGDACLMRWECIDLDANIISHTPHKTAHSSGKTVTIPMHPTLATAIAHALSWRDDASPYICPRLAEKYKRSESIITYGVQRIIRKATKLKTTEHGENGKRGVAVYGMHSFRHTFVSLCANAGVPLAVAADIVGHASPTMTEHYFHASDDAKRRAVLAIGTGTKKAGARERLLKMVDTATDAECEKMLAALEEAGKGDCGGDKPREYA